MEKCTLLLFVIGKKVKFTNEYALLLTLVFSIFSALLLSILLLLCSIRKFGPGGESFEMWSDKENQEEQ